ncbi:glucan endo-1,3-beta-glucosidase 12 [Humulus lupulus]|uniref:glucan endo-1,3-beta-glucosidase 12 n=1 Tax=Humulus lupulus TaxID=3486 RepID=UPI002B40B3D6|nr:glucan endo-1,3-beta-glucosidase 12 [Humulus lupulus]
MLKMVLLIFPIFFFCFLGLTSAGQESVQLLNLYIATPEVPKTASSHSDLPIAASVSSEDLHGVSSSVLMAESWLRTQVLAYYPANRFTTIVVGGTVLCQKGQEHKLSLVLPSVKNIHHSLTRWGLEKDIKVSAAFSSACLHPQSTYFNGDFAKSFTKPLLEFLQNTNSTYSLHPSPPKFTPLPAETASLVSSHSKCMKKLGLFELNKVNVIVNNTPKESKPMSRKLTSLNPNVLYPFPARPNPLPKVADSPLHSSVGYSIPSNVATPPQSSEPQIASPPQMKTPLAQIASPPHFSFSYAPESPPVFEPAASPPVFEPASPPYGFTLPPCDPSPYHPGAPSPHIGMVHKLWCVAKPTVPSDTLQAAIDYACGEGGADCNEILPQGNCYNPDTVVAHASYAFNSYWQKHKRTGGTCSFGGTAMLINNDPSFLHCRFVLT